MSSRVSSPLLLYLLLLVVVSVHMSAMTSQDNDQYNELSSFCYSACSHGRGGNACKCSASKFAGKRSRTPPLSQALDSSLVRSSDGWTTQRQAVGRLDRHLQAASRWTGSRLRQSGETEIPKNFLETDFFGLEQQ